MSRQFKYLVGEVEMTYKRKTVNGRQIKRSVDIYCYLKLIWSDQIEYREEFVVIFLSRSNSILGHFIVGKGGITGTVADIRMMFQGALLSNACGIILAHNHPSGALKPSESDIRLTRNVKEAGEIMEINLLDHLIITTDSYYSFKDEGIL